jgi:hypothetical protein
MAHIMFVKGIVFLLALIVWMQKYGMYQKEVKQLALSKDSFKINEDT